MKKLTLRRKASEQGFIPMLLSILAVIAGIIYFVYIRVAQANQ